MRFNKKTKSVVAGAALFSVVAPTSNMVAQAVSLKGIKQSFVSLFMRTFYFWFKSEKALKKLEGEFQTQKQELINSVKKEIFDTREKIIKNLKEFGYKKVDTLVFSENGKLNEEEDVLDFLKKKKSSVFEISKKYGKVQNYVLCFKCIKCLENLLKKTDDEALSFIRENKEIFEHFFNLNLLPPFVEKVFKKKNVESINFFEEEKKATENSIVKLKKRVVANVKEIGGKDEETILSEEFFKEKEKELWQLNLNYGESNSKIEPTAGAIITALPEYYKEIENYKNDKFEKNYEKEEKLYDLNRKIKTLKECLEESKLYYTGTLDVFD